MPLQRRQFLARLFFASLLPATAFSRPDLTRTMGSTLADRGSSFYRFENFRVTSEDGERRYRVWLAIPHSPPPEQGYSSLTLLDGNAVLHHLQEDWLAPLSENTLPVLIMVGYDTDLLFDVVARQRDYTPALPGEGLIPDPRRPERLGGGADAFLALLETRIKPEVQKRARLNLAQQSLWGHSFGGLFALYALASPSSTFTRYIPVSPATYWHNHAIDHYLKDRPSRAQVWLARGTDEVRATPDMDDAAIARLTQQGSDAFMTTVQTLAQHPPLQVHWKPFPGLSHGAMLPASLPDALAIASGKTPPGWNPHPTQS